ncbi:MAG: methyltransferase domain-containing protein [Betaproteobacteria bacterium]|nr:methyltransferase domain-containing protein [Betaproteobacteria bacterium]
MTDWLQTPAGRYLAAWECEQFDRAVADVFGFHGLQLGLSDLPALRNSRIRHCWTAQSTLWTSIPTQQGIVPLPALLADPVALPFADQSLDLVVMPHTLELSQDPHAALREVERVLVPEGRVVISGFNPVSLWGLRTKRASWSARFGMPHPFLPPTQDFIGYWRLRDWLRLLSFEAQVGHFGCYRPSVQNPTWLKRFAWMDKAGKRWWPILGSVYFLVAVKRVRGMRLISPVWKHAKARARKPVPTAHSSANADSTDNIAATQETQA